jgi:hypothetical protein
MKMPFHPEAWGDGDGIGDNVPIVYVLRDEIAIISVLTMKSVI